MGLEALYPSPTPLLLSSLSLLTVNQFTSFLALLWPCLPCLGGAAFSQTGAKIASSITLFLPRYLVTVMRKVTNTKRHTIPRKLGLRTSLGPSQGPSGYGE